MGAHGADEVRAAVDAYVDLRERIARGEAGWTDLADLFTDDVVYIDPAWGRIEGIEELRTFLDESMRGLEDWDFPIEYVAVDGDTVVVKWTQQLPGARPDGTRWEQSGYSTLVYAGDGRFSYEEDLLNMVHVLEDLKASGWRPREGFLAPPAEPVRDFSRP
jgi:ketosteroid isomerase-like protein